MAWSPPSLISTKAKPRGLPVSLSMISCTFVTVPYCEKTSRRVASVVEKAMFPTYKFLAIVVIPVHSGKEWKCSLDLSLTGERVILGGNLFTVTRIILEGCFERCRHRTRIISRKHRAKHRIALILPGKVIHFPTLTRVFPVRTTKAPSTAATP
jgi:hypothetical protein